MKKGNHISYRGVSINIDSLRNENEDVPAMGNMNVNAKGDVLGKGGVIAKTADEVAREHHRTRTVIRQVGLKGNDHDGIAEDRTKKRLAAETKAPAKKIKEIETDNRDIIIEDEK